MTRFKIKMNKVIEKEIELLVEVPDNTDGGVVGNLLIALDYGVLDTEEAAEILAKLNTQVIEENEVTTYVSTQVESIEDYKKINK